MPIEVHAKLKLPVPPADPEDVLRLEDLGGYVVDKSITPQDGWVLVFNATTQKWQPVELPTGPITPPTGDTIDWNEPGRLWDDGWVWS